MRALTLRIGLLLLALLFASGSVEAAQDPVEWILSHYDCVRDGPGC